MMKRSVHQESKNSSRKLKVYIPNNWASEYIKSNRIQGELDKSTNLLGDFKILSSVLGGTNKPVGKDVKYLSNTIHHLDSIDIYKILSSIIQVFFKCTWIIYYYYILRYKTNVNKHESI